MVKNKFIFPLQIKTPSKNPFTMMELKFWTRRFWKCLLKVCKPKEWKEPVISMLKYYQSILKEKDGNKYLPKGTKLYHGSTIFPFLGDVPSSSRITFFGLDVVISLWYILEQIYEKNDGCFLGNKKNVEMNGYLYEFVLVKDLPISHVIENLLHNPKKSNSPCKKSKNAVCLHPQISFHGVCIPTFHRDIVPMFDLCNEITFRYSEYKEYLKLKKVHHVDPYILHKNKRKKNFIVTDSIVLNKKDKQTISCKKYMEMMKQEKN